MAEQLDHFPVEGYNFDTVVLVLVVQSSVFKPHRSRTG